jgi:hypothetical protein
MFDYESPITVFQKQMEMQMEGEILKAVTEVGVYVDKDELLKALKHDREQYEKGYADGLNANKWIPCSKRLPEKEGKYLATGVKETVFMAEYKNDIWWRNGCSKANAIAWMELPPAYKGE